MNSHMEHEFVEEMQCGTNIAYVLKNNELFLQSEYKVFHGQAEGCFLKCMKTTYNGKIQFYFLVDAYKSLSSMLPHLDADSFLQISANLLECIINVKNNGFLTCGNIDISFERIYVDSNTYKVRLVYLPISRHFFGDDDLFENELRTSLVKLISGMTTLSTPKTMQFSEALSDGTLTLEDLYSSVKGGSRFGEERGAEKYLNSSIGKLRMVAMNANAPVSTEFEITKDSFTIGKKGSDVDGGIPYNKMISRVHCRIIKTNSQYMIEDLCSTNGTYVNGVRIQPNQARAISNGDIVRLANSDFQIMIE